jgi:hypothetical protein
MELWLEIGGVSLLLCENLVNRQFEAIIQHPWQNQLEPA